MRDQWPASLVLLASFASAAGAEPLPPTKPETVGMSSERLERIGNVLRVEIEQGRLPGAVVAIARKGKLVYYEALGFLEKDARVPMPKDAIFSIASMTKPLTTVGALVLYEEGRLLLNDPVGKYLPQLDAMPVAIMSVDGRTIQGTEQARRKVTLQDLMRHTAGVTYGNRGASDLHKKYDALNLNELTGPAFLEKLGALPLHYQPGTMWDYSLGLDVLGLVVEAVAKQPLGRHLEERLFKPLGMVDTAFVVPSQKVSRYARALPTDPLTGNAQRLARRL